MKKFKWLNGMLIAMLALVLAIGSFATSVKADEEENTPSPTETPTPSPTETPAVNILEGISYDPVKDSIVIASDYAATGVKVYAVKKDKDNKLKADAEGISVVKGTEIPLSADTIKAKDGAAVYLYFTDKAIPEAGAKVAANFTINAAVAKKVTGVINYNECLEGVLSATATDAKKAEISDVQIMWTTDKEATSYSTEDMTKAQLEAMYTEGGTIYFKMIGTAADKNATPAVDNVRSSKVYKVKVAKQGKAPAIKLDVKKGTITLKNGMDIALGAKSGETYTLANEAQWITILPYLKDAANAEMFVSTDAYLPADKKNEVQKKAVLSSTSSTPAPTGTPDNGENDPSGTPTPSVTPGATEGNLEEEGANADGDNDTNPSNAPAEESAPVCLSFTKTKVKAVSVQDLLDAIGGAADSDTTIIVRNSATLKKPASAIAGGTIKAAPAAPSVTAENGVIATAEDKLAFDAPTVTKAATSDLTTDFEMAIVKLDDLGDLDVSTVGWKKIGKITDKTSTKIGKAKVGLSKLDEVVILIRGAGVKAKSIDECSVPGAYVVTYIVKETTKDSDNNDVTKYVWKVGTPATGGESGSGSDENSGSQTETKKYAKVVFDVTPGSGDSAHENIDMITIKVNGIVANTEIDSETFEVGTEVTIVLEPTTNFELSEVTVNGASNGVSEDDGVFTVTFTPADENDITIAVTVTLTI